MFARSSHDLEVSSMNPAAANKTFSENLVI